MMCALLERLGGWEAVKVTKGHYRSCGKDPHACCVSHLLSDKPLVLSEREQTDVRGKDTGRFWKAGASNVHWVVATKDGVGDGVSAALARVSPIAPGVLVEGTGFVRTLPVDFVVMVAAVDQHELKPSAARVFARADALVVYGSSRGSGAVANVKRLLSSRDVSTPLPPVFFDDEIPRLAEMIEARCRVSTEPLGAD